MERIYAAKNEISTCNKCHFALVNLNLFVAILCKKHEEMYQENGALACFALEGRNGFVLTKTGKLCLKLPLGLSEIKSLYPELIKQKSTTYNNKKVVYRTVRNDTLVPLN